MMRDLEHSFLKKVPIAHRGYHGPGIPENSLPAAENAIQHGYAIELDVRETKDGKLIVFHDEYTKRLLGIDGRIGKYTYDEIKDLNLLGIEGVHVPLFSDFLEYVNGRVPLLVELKAALGKSHLVEHVVEAMKGYKGDYVYQSFNPLYLIKLRKIAPEAIRGQLITKDLSEMPLENIKDRLAYAVVWLFGFTSLNKITDPDFYNIDIRCFRKYQKRYAIRNIVTNVITNESDLLLARRYTDNIVFENMNLDEVGKKTAEEKEVAIGNV